MKNAKGSLILLLASIIWGSTFVAQSKGMDYIGPLTYCTSRFILGFLVLTPASIISLKKEKPMVKDYKGYVRNTILIGLLIGIPEGLASILQQIGLVGTTASKAGFITALYIVIVPLLGLFFKKKVPIAGWVAVFVALAGFYLLSVTESFTINSYDICLVGCAILFSIQILGIDMLAKNCNSILFTQMMFGCCFLISLVLMLIFEKPNLQSILDCAWPILYAGVFSCGLAYSFQTIGQKSTNPTLASLIMSLESVFAAISGFLFLNDSLTGRELLGCIMIFSGVILSQITDLKLKK